MSQNPSVRTIRESLLAASRASAVDPVAIESLRADIVARLEEMRHSMERAFDFSNRGLVSEAASVVTDFPELAQEADALVEVAMVDPQSAQSWRAIVGNAVREDQLPRRDEIERLATIAMRADALRPLLDALRLSALRREPVTARMRVLRRLRAEDARNRMWLDQIEALEQEWLRSMAELRNRDATREELDEALVALETHDWIASVPRGLREELFAKVKPLRAEEAGARYQLLADEIHAAASRMDRADILRLEQEWAAIHQETGRMPSDDLVRIVTPAFEWLTRLDEEARAQQAFDAEVDRLEVLLNERRAVAEIEAQVAVLRDAGRATPDGLIERATQYCFAEQERVRQRHRLVLAASILGAIVLVAVGALALSLHTASREREALLVTLRDAVSAKDAARLAPLVAEIRASVSDPGPDLAASLTEADVILDARARRTEEIRTLLASAEKELAGTPTRARVEVLRQSLAAAIKDAEDPDRSYAQRVDAQRVAVLAVLDTKASEDAATTIGEVDRALLAWPIPDAWRDTEMLDEARWNAYLTALEGLRSQLDAGIDRVDGHESSMSRLGVKRDAIEKRVAEAKSRIDALRVAMRELSDDKLLAPVSSEKQFIDRLDSAIKAHGPVLARRSQLAEIEQSLTCRDAYIAMEAWRIELRPKLAAALGPNLSNRPTPEVAAQVLSDIRAFVGTHPAAPMRDILTRLAADIDPNAGAEVWSPHRLELELAAEFLSSIEEVPLADGRRFYRRPSIAVNLDGTQKSPLTRALKTLADIPTDPDKLSAILAVQSSEMKGRTFANPVSLAWARAQEKLGSCQSHEVMPVILALFADITKDSNTDSLLRCRALREATRCALDSGLVQGKLRELLQKWQARCREEFAGAMTADWVAAGYDKDFTAWRKMRTEATNAIAAFPDTAALREEIERESRRLGDALSALVPVGVMGFAQMGSRTRIAQISGSRENLFMLIRGTPLWLVTPITVENGQVQSVPEAAPAGPVLIYRRNRP